MTIKVKNITNRVFNWIQPGETINVEEKLKATYIHAGFKEVKAETKKEEKVENKKTTKWNTSKKVEVKAETKKEKK